MRIWRSVEGIFACGKVVHDLVDHVTKDGEEAGQERKEGRMDDFRGMRHVTLDV